MNSRAGRGAPQRARERRERTGPTARPRFRRGAPQALQKAAVGRPATRTQQRSRAPEPPRKSAPATEPNLGCGGGKGRLPAPPTLAATSPGSSGGRRGVTATSPRPGGRWDTSGRQGRPRRAATGSSAPHGWLGTRAAPPPAARLGQSRAPPATAGPGRRKRA